ncbi:glycoside hydrolase superfamily [Aspergillus avenaceus]|uniref:chitinase n=1 Tax=Aspergillus avenaceus TaxID=36643 RepID=A0A5N6TZV2_ASPAV|nr:glycoside hydrolase superfamily [Aspergillus avenaceus]
MEPPDIPLGVYTHINFAFASIDPKVFRIRPTTNNTAKRYFGVTALTDKQPGLKVYISLGGWDFNEPGPTRNTFSDLAASESAQDMFFDSLISFMTHNAFDGVDLDWEYPWADDRGGRPEDLVNFVTLLKRLRQRLTQGPMQFGLTITVPATYWYLRGFDLANLEPHVDWFNVMTYDIHGLWDADGKEIGNRAYAHTNLTEITLGLELFWRNNINPERVVMGLGFYGRSFKLEDPKCLAPGCRDDVETLKLKIDYANKRCLGGTMVWAVDLDDGTLSDALGKAMNKTKIDPIKDPYAIAPCFGSPWPKWSNKTWLGNNTKDWLVLPGNNTEDIPDEEW